MPLRSTGLVAAHRALVAAGLLASLALLGQSIARHDRRVASVVAAAVLVAASVGAVATWPLIEWDQVALWAVTVGTDLDGLWFPGFSDEVRFVLVDEFEVTKSTYSRLVAAHLVGLPLVSAAALTTWWRTSR